MSIVVVRGGPASQVVPGYYTCSQEICSAEGCVPTGVEIHCMNAEPNGFDMTYNGLTMQCDGTSTSYPYKDCSCIIDYTGCPTGSSITVVGLGDSSGGSGSGSSATSTSDSGGSGSGSSPTSTAGSGGSDSGSSPTPTTSSDSGGSAATSTGTGGNSNSGGGGNSSNAVASVRVRLNDVIFVSVVLALCGGLLL
ncbi:hypothetical protein ONS96_009930 [Cadophora gregata f. sp. sojae]|nr:hypothetical protein ONS96_009930 [Cadophora gregata f. sp. sojae]